VGNETREWRTGAAAFAFDDSFEHEVNHEGGERRVVLIVDCWHPALRPAERVLIRDLFRALDLPKR
jgi:aspartate beta-hydroxylase